MPQVVLLVAVMSAAPHRPSDTVVVCPSALRAALDSWLEYRTDQGHGVAVIPSGRSAAEIRSAIRRRADRDRLRFVVLIGDAAAPAHRHDHHLCVPAHAVRARVNIRWGSEPEIATDNWYADLDDDGVPDVAVGRIPSDSPRELAATCAKILAYEQGRQFGCWRRRINFVAGVGGFGAVADKAVELASGALVSGAVPPAYATTMTYANSGSIFCPNPFRFHSTTMQRLNEGCLAWVYMGHGHRRTLDRVAIAGFERPILSAGDVRQLDCREGRPVAVLMACYAGAFDAPEDCLAEEMLRHDGGPVAVIAASRVTMPYGMAVLGTELLKELFAQRASTLGETILQAKRALADSNRAEGPRAALDLLARIMVPGAGDLSAERMEHICLFNLIGDPLLRLHHPRAVILRAPATVDAGTTAPVSGTCDVSGPCTVELVTGRGHLSFTPPARSPDDLSAGSLALWQETYERANDPRLSTAVCRVKNGRFATFLEVPRGAQGTYQMRVFVEGKEGFALGAAPVTVRCAERAALRTGAGSGGPSSPPPGRPGRRTSVARYSLRGR